jgi:hypothetical protein
MSDEQPLLTLCKVCDTPFQTDDNEEFPGVCPECRAKLIETGEDLSALDGDEEEAEEEDRDAAFFIISGWKRQIAAEADETFTLPRRNR